MELEELKKSWNALDEHLKDKEFIKEEELEKLIRHPCHCQTEHQAYSDFSADTDLIFSGGTVT